MSVRAVIVQARMASTRLPGKALADVAGRPLLGWMLERLIAGVRADYFLVATPYGPENEPIANVAHDYGWRVVRGAEDDVVGRVWLAAEQVHADAVAFMGADQPLIAPKTVNAVLDAHDRGYDYVRTTGQPWGLQAWAIGRQALLNAAFGAADDTEREHTGAFWDRRPEQYPCHVLREWPDESAHRLTVDTPADLELHRRIIGVFASCWPRVATDDILEVLAAHPEWEDETRGVVQWRWSGHDAAVAL